MSDFFSMGGLGMMSFGQLRIAWIVPLVLGAAAGIATTSHAGPPGREEGSSFVYASDELKLFEEYYGLWKVSEQHFDEQGQPVGVVEATEEVAWMLDRHAIRRTYARTAGVVPYRAVGILTWNDVRSVYEGTWFDNVSKAGPNHVTGVWDASEQTMTFTMESLLPTGRTVTYRIVDRFVDSDNRVATTYSVDGKETVKRMEVKYKRTRACPAKVQRVFDG